MTHKLYRLVNGNVAGIHPYENIRLFDFQRIWLSGFLDDPDIPVGVSAFITYYIGHEWEQMKLNDKYYDKKVKKKDKGHSYEDSVRYEFLAQRWPEKSMMTNIPIPCAVSISSFNSSGVPKRELGAKKLET